MSVRRLLTVALVPVFAVAGMVADADGLPRHIVVDPVTGFAARGFDPVAYFAEADARAGRADHEAVWQGAAWRFVNEGNRAAFLADPQVYAPSFGGHGAVAAARGFLAEGNPEIWAIHDARLYFFHSRSNRHVFLMDPDHIVAEAEAFWARQARR